MEGKFMVKNIGYVIDGLLILSVLLVAYSQLIRPMFKKTPVFPFFRRRRNIEREIEVANEELEEQNLERTLDKTRNKLSKPR